MLNSKVDYSQLGITKKNELKVEKTKNLNITWKTGTAGEKIWMGKIIAEPSAESAAQHHQESDTVHYVLKGKAVFFYGEGYKSSVELNEGDFIYIPPYHPYIYKNGSNVESFDIVTTMAPNYKVEYVDQNENIEIPGDDITGEVLIVRASDLNDLTNQTKNMPRRTAVQAPNLWIGRVTGEPAMDSGEHHHGEAETAGFIISGITRLLHGERYEDYEEYEPGDFLRVPPYLPHIERNMSNTDTVEFLTARNPRNIVVNIES
ncbi:cupin domain-containing protein [Neobacillus mesonae]|uniref:cupin domain-containing protein n=1 Tax=Neobacillus mesonae TaxID=1193713 RepID=UPI00203C996E|nr:cupin domain-containing protein [Neobacillus mesonae]MCM3568084.1 cupin domain-containing protein [Neobacillus mesonae]